MCFKNDVLFYLFCSTNGVIEKPLEETTEDKGFPEANPCVSQKIPMGQPQPYLSDRGQ